MEQTIAWPKMAARATPRLERASQRPAFPIKIVSMTSRRAFKQTIHFLALSAIVLFFLWHGAGHAVPVGLAGPQADGLTQALPKLHFYASELHSGRMPTWDPWTGAGSPDYVVRSHVVYPTTLITTWLFEPWIAMLVDMAANFVLAYLFAFLLFRRAGSPAAAAGALVVVFGGLNLRYVFYPYFCQTAAWIPLVFLAVEGLFSPGATKCRSAMIGAAALGMMILAGMINYLIYTVVFGALYFLVEAFSLKEITGAPRLERTRAAVIAALVMGVLGLGLGAARLLPLLGQSDLLRGGYETWDAFRGLLMTVGHLAASPAPGAFGEYKFRLVAATTAYGTLAWVLSLSYLVAGKKSGKDWFWIGTIFLGLATCIISPLTRALFSVVPGFGDFEPTRIWSVAGIGLAWTAARAIGQLNESNGRKLSLAAAMWGSILLVALISVALVRPLEHTRHLIPAFVGFGGIAVLVVLNKRLKGDRLVWVAALLVGLEVFVRAGVSAERIDTRVHYRQTPITRALQSDPDPYRVIRIGDRWNWYRDGRLYTQEALKMSAVEDLHAYSSMIPPTLRTLTDAFRARRDFGLPPFELGASIQPFLTDSPVQNGLADAINARYVLSQVPLDEGAKLSLAATHGGLYLYKNSDALPRASWVPNAYWAADETEALDRLVRQVPFRDEVTLVGQADRERMTNDGGNAKVRTLNRSATGQDYQVESDRAGWLVVTDLFDKDWQVSINGRKTRLHRANLAFRTVAVPAGKNTVKFSYRPKLFWTGLAISVITLILAGVAILVGRRRQA